MDSMAKKVTRTRQSLASLGGIIGEATKVYRLARAGKMDHKEARSLVWMLGEIRQMVEAQALEKIEARLAELGEAADIGSGRTRPPAFGMAVH
jgi:hypothetical protein